MGRPRTSAGPRRKGGGFRRTDWRVHVARLGSFLAHTRAIRDLVDDAHEKHEDDYVFDRRYILSLVDTGVEHLDALLFDARVMEAVTGDLVDRHRECLVTARELHARAAGESVAVPEGPDADSGDPEYVLLEACTRWLEGAGPRDGSSAMGVVRRAVDCVFGAIGSDRRLGERHGLPALGVRGTGTIVEVADLGGGLRTSNAESLALGDVRCQPLGLMLMGAHEAAQTGADAGAGERWLAVVDRQHVSLRRASGARPTFLEATVTGGHAADWLFVYEPGEVLLEDPPSGTRAERTDSGNVLWSRGSAPGPEEALVRLGRRLFGPGE